MEGRYAVPFHFAVEFLVLVVAIGAALDAVRARKHGAGAWSLGQAAGFFALAVAQVAHGSLLAQPDAERGVVIARALAFLILAASARPAASIAPPSLMLAAGAAPALFFPGADSGLAFAPAVAAALVAARGVRAHRVDLDPATFAFAAAFVAFGAGEALTAFAPADGGGMLIAAHCARALAVVFLSRWLWSSIGRSVRTRTVASFVLVLTVGVLVVSGVLNVVIGDTLQDSELQRLRELGGARVNAIHELGENALASANLFSSDRLFAGGVSGKGDAVGELRRVARFFPPDFIMLVDMGLRVRGSAENAPGRHDGRGIVSPGRAIAIAGTEVVGEALIDRPAYGVEAVRFQKGAAQVSEMVAIAAVPIKDGAVVGAVVVGYRIDQSFLQTVKADAGGAEATLVLAGGAGASTFKERAPVEKAFGDARKQIDAARLNNKTSERVLAVGTQEYLTSFVPVTLSRGSTQVVGMLALSLPGVDLAAAQRRTTTTLFLVTLLAVAIAAMLAWLSSGRVTKPIRSLTAAARELRGGNLQARARVASTDEVGSLGTAFNEMADELQRTTRDLQSSAGTMEAILQSMGDGLIATDAHGAIVTVNRAAERMIGKRAERVIGRSINDVLQGSAAGRPLAEVALAQSASDGVLKTADRAGISIAMTSAPLMDARGTHAGRVIVIRDMSREHEAERMKSEFLSNVSHELRTPITPIKGYAEIMRRKQFPRQKAEEFLEGILESTDRLERIVEILVDFAAMEAGRLKPRAEAVPVRKLLDEVTAKWRDKGSKHQFVRKVSTDLPPILGDPRLLGRSLDELVDNAVKFSPDGGKIEIIAEPYSNGAHGRRVSKIAITIRDHGIGIEPEQMPDLFRDFRQLDGSETRTYGGLGLGLAYVKRIATVHGGEVFVQSKPGRGSSFSLVLPAADAAAVKPRKAVKTGTLRSKTAAGRKR